MTGSAFSFVPRERCICGERLGPSASLVTRRWPRGGVSFVRCDACGSWCQSPQLRPESLATWYDSDEYQGSARRGGSVYVNYAADEAVRLAEAQVRYRRDLNPCLPVPGRVLEVGCASGSLLAVLRQHGWNVTGVELSPAFAALARDLNGLDVIVGNLAEVAVPAAPFDAVVMLGTISAMADLDRQLRRIHALLKPGGMLLFNFPDAASPLVRYLYRSRSWMFAPSVSCFMTAEGCRRALTRAGFEVEKLARDWQQPSIAKLLLHAGLPRAARAAGRYVRGLAVPAPVPIPGVRFVRARRSSEPH